MLVSVLILFKNSLYVRWTRVVIIAEKCPKGQLMGLYFGLSVLWEGSVMVLIRRREPSSVLCCSLTWVWLLSLLCFFLCATSLVLAAATDAYAWRVRLSVINRLISGSLEHCIYPKHSPRSFTMTVGFCSSPGVSYLNNNKK